MDKISLSFSSQTYSSRVIITQLPRIPQKSLFKTSSNDDQLPTYFRADGNVVIRANPTSRRQFQLVSSKDLLLDEKDQDKKRIKNLCRKESQSQSEQEQDQPDAGIKNAFFKLYRGKKVKLKTQRKVKLLESMTGKIIKKQLAPRTFGVLADSHVLNVNGSKMGNKYSEVISEVLNEQNYRKVKLGDCRLNDNGLANFISKANDAVEELELSKNKLGFRTIYNIVGSLPQKLKNLEVLNLSSVGLKDRELALLSKGLADNETRLKSLNLGRNRLTRKGIQSLSQVLSLSSLEVLVLNWNNLFYDSGNIIFLSLKSSRLKVLDLSFNSLGGSQQQSCAHTIKKSLLENTYLIHLDLAGNRFSQTQLRLIEEGFHSNHTIFGLHLECHCLSINSRGYIKSEELPSNKQSSIDGVALRAIKKLRYKPAVIRDVCWICDGWQEFYFKLKSEKPAWVLFHFDNFELRYMGKAKKGEIEYLTLLPPGRIYFFFIVGGQPTVLDQFKVVDYPVTRRYDIQALGQILNVDVKLSGVNSLKIRYTEESIVSATGSVLTDYRPRAEPTLQEFAEKGTWSFQKSIFARFYSQEDKMQACFENDWSMSKIFKIEKNIEQLEEVKSLLRQNYPRIFDTYRELSSYAPIASVYCIQIIKFGEFCQAIGLFSKEFMSKHSDLTFVATKGATDFKHERIPERGLVRFQFLESLVRLAKEKYMKQFKRLSEAVRHFLATNFSSYRAKPIVAWRTAKFFTEEIDTTIRLNRSKFMFVYEKYSKKKVMPGCKRFMCLEEFKEIASILFPAVNDKAFVYKFNSGLMEQVDEVYSSRFYQTTFMEFIEALCRLVQTFNKEDLPLHEKLGQAINAVYQFLTSSEKQEEPEVD